MSPIRTLCRAGGDIAWQRFTPKHVKPGTAPLLLIHGFACGKEDWGAVPRIVGTKAQREVISFDNRGIGHSTHPSGSYSVEQMTNDACGVLHAAGVDKACVLGISLGGMIAQKLALDHPERVCSLIIGCSSHGGREATPLPAAFLELCQSWAAHAEPNESTLISDFMKLMLPAAFLDTPAGQKLFVKFEQAFLSTRRTSSGLQGQFAAMGRFNSTKRLAELRVPTLIVSGSEDVVVLPSNSHSLAQRIPDAQLQVWQGAGHFWWAHRPVDAAEMLAQFLMESDDK